MPSLSSARSAAAAQGAQAPNFQPVRTRRAFEAVCDQVRRQVAEGTLLPGQRLPGPHPPP